jgi:hypothetical protein
MKLSRRHDQSDDRNRRSVSARSRAEQSNLEAVATRRTLKRGKLTAEI